MALVIIVKKEKRGIDRETFFARGKILVKKSGERNSRRVETYKFPTLMIY